VDGPVVAPFAPIGRYAGHWGVDFSVASGVDVHAPAAGTVVFAGSVAGRLSVSIDHGRGMISTVSYVSEVLAGREDRVSRGTVIARSGLAHGLRAVHLSLRIEGVYVDPWLLLACRGGDIPDALHLIPVPSP